MKGPKAFQLFVPVHWEGWNGGEKGKNRNNKAKKKKKNPRIKKS